MTWSRWKLTAGFLGVSIGGLAATAGPQCDAGRQRPAPPPTVVPVQALSAVPPVVPVAATDGARVAMQPPVAVPPPTTVEAPKVAPVQLTPPLPVVAVGLPKPAEPVPAPAIELPKVELPPLSPKPAEKVVELPLPSTPVIKPADPVPPLPAVEIKIAPPAVPETPKPLPASDLPPASPAPMPALVKNPRADEPIPDIAPTPKLAQPDQAPPGSLGNPPVRVLLRLGGGQPTFDVLAGDDTLLKVACAKVDVRSPSDKGDAMTPLKASGRVTFSAPGCEGTCDELTVLPGTGEVELAGNVRVRCRRGKGETEFAAGTMRFKLGSAPAYTVPEPVTRTSFTPGRK